MMLFSSSLVSERKRSISPMFSFSSSSSSVASPWSTSAEESWLAISSARTLEYSMILTW